MKDCSKKEFCPFKHMDKVVCDIDIDWYTPEELILCPYEVRLLCNKTADRGALWNEVFLSESNVTKITEILSGNKSEGGNTMKNWKEVTVVEFVEGRQRMCDSMDGCNVCPLSEYEDEECEGMVTNPKLTEVVVTAVMKWCEENRVVTVLEKLLEVFPNARVNHTITPYGLGTTNEPSTTKDQINEAWNQPYVPMKPVIFATAANIEVLNHPKE